MEIEGEDGSKLSLESGSKRELGRGLGFPLDDRTVSRRHISLEFLENGNPQDSEETKTRVHFEALGKNPVWVFDSRSGDVRVLRKSDKGFMRVGDCFCISTKKNPILFTLKRSREDEKGGLNELEQRLSISADEEMAEQIASDENLGFQSPRVVADIDPVKEFGFLVIGHEFDNYPRGMIRSVKDWEWFIEELREDSDTDDVSKSSRSKGNKGVRRKKKDEVNDDEDWTGESDNEKVVISKLRKGKRPRYSMTRSKDLGNPPREIGTSKKLDQNKFVHEIKDEEGEGEEEEDDDDDEYDYTLGGFIVSDEDPEEEEYEEEEEEELEDVDVIED